MRKRLNVSLVRTQSHTYMNTESLSTTWASMSKGNPYNLWTRYLYNRSRFLFSFIDVYSSAAPSERPPLVKDGIIARMANDILKTPLLPSSEKTCSLHTRKNNLKLVPAHCWYI